MEYSIHKMTNKIFLNNFPASELCIQCIQLTWQEQENLGTKTHLAALPKHYILRLYQSVFE